MTQMIKPVKARPALKPEAAPDLYAVAGLILSLMWMGGFASLAGVTLTHISRGRAQRAGYRPSAVAEWGNWLGCIGLAFTALLITLLVMHATGN